MTEPELDFEALLKKYVRHVGQCEGTNFIWHIGRPWSEEVFTDAERRYMEALAGEETDE